MRTFPGSWRRCPLQLLILLAACRTAEQHNGPQAPPVGWPHYAADAGATRYSPLTDITPDNVRRLVPVWRWATGESEFQNQAGVWVRPGKFESTPLAFGDTLFFTTPFNKVVALDGRRGQPMWSFDPDATRDGLIADDRAGFVHRGVATWADATSRRILVASRWKLFALDAATGRPIPQFGERGWVDLGADLRWPVNRAHLGATSPPVVMDDLVIVGSAIGDRIMHEKDPPGAVQAFDVRTGKRRWRWDPVPRAGSPGAESWEGRANEHTGHGNVWAPFTVDETAGLVFLPVSAASNDYYGGNRLGDNLYTQSLVCLDARTGTLKWAQQLVHHDLWDYDPASPPTLVQVRHRGVVVDAVILAGKTGYLYAFERHTGRPLWPWEERATPASDVPGERAARTQPHPTWPKPFARQQLGVDDLIDFTPALRAAARDVLAPYRFGGMFLPPSVQGTVQLPGWIGGAGWGSTAIDPVRGVAYVKASNLPVLARVQPTNDDRRYATDTAITDPAKALTVALPPVSRAFWRRAQQTRAPIIKPPYGTLTAIDLHSGNHLWSVPLGDTPAIRTHPSLADLQLPPLGVVGAPGGAVTASGLIFIAGGGDVLYALAASTGETLWSAALGRVGYSNPMTFRATNGRQYVVIATGEGAGAQLQAFALPLAP